MTYDHWKTTNPEDEWLGDPPQQWFVCEACDGDGITRRGIRIYEHGCGFAHDDVEEIPCGKCNGAGGWLDDAETDRY